MLCQVPGVPRKGGFAVLGQSVQCHGSTDRLTLKIARRVFRICLLCSLFASACTQAETPLPGGFSKVERDRETVSAAQFAVDQISKKLNEPLELKDIVSAERQVVAGLNYRLELDLTKSNQPFRVRAIVWRKLDGSMELTSWNAL